MSGHIPETFIADLLARVDIVEVIDALVPLKKAGKDYKACCPFHEERTPSFTVSADKQFFHCFGCGAHGSAIGFLMQYEHLPFPEAVEQLARRAGLEVPKSASTARPEEDRLRESLETVLLEADRFFRRQLREHPQARIATDYLKSRGLTGEFAAAFGLGFAPEGWDNLLRAIGTEAATAPSMARGPRLDPIGDDARRNLLVQAGLAVRKDDGGLYDRFRGRVMFPIHDYRGKLIGFGGRVIGAGEPKYLNSPETPLFHKGRELYGLYRARDALARDNRVLVVEGYMDVVSLAQFGYDGAVATLGTATTRDHLERLYRYCPEIVFCFDGDRAGRAAAWRALENALPVLRDGRQASFLFLPEGEDPDTLVRKEGVARLRARIEAAKPLPDYFFEHLSEQTDLSRLDGRARLVKLAEPFLAKLPAGVLAALMRARLAEIAHLDPSALPASPPPKSELGSRLAPPVRKATSSGKQSPETKVFAHALALLIQCPDLAASVDKSIDISKLSSPLAMFWQPLLDFLAMHPTSRTGAICEHFRDTEFAATLGELAARPLPEHPDAELADAMKQLARAINREEMLSNVGSGIRPSDMSDQTKATHRSLGARKNELDRR